MAGLGLMNRRRAIQSSPVTTDIMESCVGKYWFRGKKNTDADRNIVVDESGNGNDLYLYDFTWGYEDASNAWQKEGYFDDQLWFSSAGSPIDTKPYGRIVMQPLNSCTIIIKRFPVFNYTDGGMWPIYGVLMGSGYDLTHSRYNIEYKSPENKLVTVNAGKTVTEFINQDVVWLNDTHYCGKKFSGTSNNRVHDGVFYLHRLRGNADADKCYMRVSCIYIFNRSLTPSEIENVINSEIDSNYKLPTIE